jgi:hypothetical protein
VTELPREVDVTERTERTDLEDLTFTNLSCFSPWLLLGLADWTLVVVGKF